MGSFFRRIAERIGIRRLMIGSLVALFVYYMVMFLLYASGTISKTMMTLLLSPTLIIVIIANILARRER